MFVCTSRQASGWCFCLHHRVLSWWLKLASGEPGPKTKCTSKHWNRAMLFDLASLPMAAGWSQTIFKIPSNRAILPFYDQAHKTKANSFSRCSPSLFFFHSNSPSFVFDSLVLSWTRLPRALYAALEGPRCSSSEQPFLQHTSLPGDHRSQPRWLGSSWPCSFSDCFF